MQVRIKISKAQLYSRTEKSSQNGQKRNSSTNCLRPEVVNCIRWTPLCEERLTVNRKLHSTFSVFVLRMLAWKFAELLDYHWINCTCGSLTWKYLDYYRIYRLVWLLHARSPLSIVHVCSRVPSSSMSALRCFMLVNGDQIPKELRR